MTGKLMADVELANLRSQGFPQSSIAQQLMSHIDALQTLLNEAAPEGAPTSNVALQTTLTRAETRIVHLRDEASRCAFILSEAAKGK